jgi:hypothetical protein
MGNTGLFGGGFGRGYGGRGYYGRDDDPTFGSELGDAMAAVGAMNKMKGMADEQKMNSRLDKMAKVMSDSGGDIFAITPDMYGDRAGLAAYASLVKTWRDTEDGKAAVRKAMISNAENQYNMFTTHSGQIEKMIQAGDGQGASLAMENLSRQAHLPYELKWNEQNKSFDVLHNTPEGNVPTGQTMSMGDAWASVQGLVKNRKEFMRSAMTYAQAVADTNLDAAMNPDKTLVARDKKGNELQLVPNIDLPYGQAPKVGFYSPSHGRSFTMDELAQAGFTLPRTTKGDQAERALDVKEEMNSIRADAAAQRASDAAARLGLAQENADLRRVLGDASLAKNDAAMEDDLFDQMIEQSVPGAFKKNKSWFVEGDDGEAHPLDPEIASSARSQARAMTEKQTGRKRPGEDTHVARPAVDPAKAFLDKVLGRK